MAMRPVLMLFDEPTSALDPELVGEVLEVIRALAQDGMTMLVVTHEMQFAREVGTRILFMDSGRILEDAAPGAFFAQPEQPRAREFLRRIHAPGAGLIAKAPAPPIAADQAWHGISTAACGRPHPVSAPHRGVRSFR